VGARSRSGRGSRPRQGTLPTERKIRGATNDGAKRTAAAAAPRHARTHARTGGRTDGGETEEPKGNGADSLNPSPDSDRRTRSYSYTSRQVTRAVPVPVPRGRGGTRARVSGRTPRRAAGALVRVAGVVPSRRSRTHLAAWTGPRRGASCERAAPIRRFL
jgi:hypothetical protein